MTDQNLMKESPINAENIRKVWHNEEWYFSVVDIIAESSGRNQAEATVYWRKLRHRLTKEGNESVTKLDALKLPARDGKMRTTEVVNVEQALRLLQEIPGARTDGVKNWLAQVGAERLEEAEDPELSLLLMLNRVTEQYKVEGRSNSWIEARIQGIVTRKEFVEALRLAVLDASRGMYAQATEHLYKGLWYRTTAQLRGELRITIHDNPRDHFGEYALIYTRLAEKVAADRLGQAETVLLYQALEIIWEVAKMISKHANDTSKMLGIDLVTGRPLLPEKNIDEAET